MLAKLKAANPEIAFYSVFDKEFSLYGNVTEYDAAPFLAAAKNIARPNGGTKYIASVPEFEALPCADDFKQRFFGGIPAQIGICHGHSSYLGGTEWHNCNEINIALTDLVLLLAHRKDIDGERLSSKCFKAFFVPRGTVIEVYSSTLHFCPCEADADGFSCIVALTDGTNTPLDYEPDDKRLFCKNKWLMAHDDNAALLSRGAVGGIYGENYRIKY